MGEWERRCIEEKGKEYSKNNMEVIIFFFQAEDGIRNLVRSRGLGDVYRGQCVHVRTCSLTYLRTYARTCPLYTTDAADEEDSADLGGRRIIKKKITSEPLAQLTLPPTIAMNLYV